MTRKVFLSYQHEDQLTAKGFNLMRYNRNLDLDFVTRGLLDPVKSDNPNYVSDRIRAQLRGTSVTVVLVGAETAGSSWVEKEIDWSLNKRPPNGLVGVKLDPQAEAPEGLEGAEILDWSQPADVQEFGAAIERAAMGARRMSAARALVGANGSCGR